MSTLSEAARQMGRKGGRNSIGSLTPAQRSERGRRGALVRWGKRREHESNSQQTTVPPPVPVKP